MTVFFGRIGIAFGEDKRKMCGPGLDIRGGYRWRVAWDR